MPKGHLDKFQHPFMINVLETVGLKKTHLNIANPRAMTNIMLFGENLEAILFKSGPRQDCPLSPPLFNVMFKVLARRIRQKKKITGTQWGKKQRVPI